MRYVYASTPFWGACTEERRRRLHSTHPYGITKYDFRFAMINVVPFEMINDEFRVVVADLQSLQDKRNDSFRNDR